MKTLFNIFFALLFGFSFYAQNVGINSTGVAPDNSSMLDIVSTDKGVLVPRVNIIDLNTAAPVTAPANSLLVYNTNVASGVGFYFWDGTKWTNLKDANSNSDEDWYEVGGTSSPDDINDNIFTQGNVGIGRLNPQIKFVVSEGNSANTSVALEGFNSGYAGLPTILPPTGSHFGGIVHGGTNGQLVLGIRENDVNDGLLIASGGGDYDSDNTYDNAILFARNDGNIGISMIAPDERLHINGNLALDSYQLGVGNGIFFRDGFNSSSNPYNMSITSDTFDGGTTPDALSINGYEGVSISTGHNTVLQRRLTVVNNGNVGIGTVAPVTQLQITNGTNYGNIMLGNNGGTTNNHITHETSGDFVVWNGTFGSGNRLMSIISNGRVISHLTNQSTTLKPSGWGGGLESNWDVWAAASVGGGVTGTAATWSISNAGVAAKPGGGAWNATSDRRTKKGIMSFTDGLNVLNNINPVTFKYNGLYNTPNDDKTYVGIIAQEVQQVAPYMIDSYKAPKYEDSEKLEEILNYDGGTYMLYVLVNSVKELQKENELLKQQLDELGKKLE